MRIIKCKNTLTAILSGGRIIQTNECTDEIFKQVVKLQEEDNEFELINLLIPEMEEDRKTNARIIEFRENITHSDILSFTDNSVYWQDVSPLSLPQEFAEKILEAERQNNAEAIEAYRNFWTLLSLNPDAEVRKNLFKFLFKWGMVITKSGLFVGYRNAKWYREDFDGTPIYTDAHSGTTRIKIGQMVTLPREKCDSDSSVECSNGLHIGGTSWLNQHYFGDIGLVCLVNPCDVIAVPWANSEYGKLRTCAYLPIAKADYDHTGHIIPFQTDSGFEAPFVPTILYDGVMNSEDTAQYVIPIPKSPNYELDKPTVSENILDIARQYMKERT